MITRPILLGIVGDSGAGKTTLTRGLVRVLGEHRATHISADDYHRYDRHQRAEHGLTPLHPDCNHLDILEQHLVHLRAGDPILTPTYRHGDGSFAAAKYVRPTHFAIVEGMLGFHTAAMRDTYDVRVFLDPPEEVRRRWKVRRDCSRRGYTTDEVLEELDRREADAEAFVRPQRRHADIIVSFTPDSRSGQHLDASVSVRSRLVDPELAAVIEGDDRGISVRRGGSDCVLVVPGTISRERSTAIQEAVWDRMHFASHLRTERLGELTVGTRLARSEPLAITQLLVLYQLVTARAAIAVGAEDAPTDDEQPDSHDAAPPKSESRDPAAPASH